MTLEMLPKAYPPISMPNNEEVLLVLFRGFLRVFLVHSGLQVVFCRGWKGDVKVNRKNRHFHTYYVLLAGEDGRDEWGVSHHWVGGIWVLLRGYIQSLFRLPNDVTRRTQTKREFGGPGGILNENWDVGRNRVMPLFRRWHCSYTTTTTSTFQRPSTITICISLALSYPPLQSAWLRPPLQKRNVTTKSRFVRMPFTTANSSHPCLTPTLKLAVFQIPFLGRMSKASRIWLILWINTFHNVRRSLSREYSPLIGSCHSIVFLCPTDCGSCWAHGSISSLGDRIKIARGAQGDDINLSIQFILNCGTETAGRYGIQQMLTTWSFWNPTLTLSFFLFA